jgi:hypothetical protein
VVFLGLVEVSTVEEIMRRDRFSALKGMLKLPPKTKVGASRQALP